MFYSYAPYRVYILYLTQFLALSYARLSFKVGFGGFFLRLWSLPDAKPHFYSPTLVAEWLIAPPQRSSPTPTPLYVLIKSINLYMAIL